MKAALCIEHCASAKELWIVIEHSMFGLERGVLFFAHVDCEVGLLLCFQQLEWSGCEADMFGSQSTDQLQQSFPESLGEWRPSSSKIVYGQAPNILHFHAWQGECIHNVHFEEFCTWFDTMIRHS